MSALCGPFPTAFIVPHHLPVCRQLHTDSPAQFDSIWTWRNAHMRSEGSSPTGDRTRVARLAVQCSTDWATPSTRADGRSPPGRTYLLHWHSPPTVAGALPGAHLFTPAINPDSSRSPGYVTGHMLIRVKTKTINKMYKYPTSGSLLPDMHRA